MLQSATPQYLPIMTSIQASEHPCSHDCMGPLLHHLKGASLGRHRGFQAANFLVPEHGKSVKGSYCIILKGHHSGATGDFRPPTFWPQNMANLINRCSCLRRTVKSVLGASWPLRWTTQGTKDFIEVIQGTQGFLHAAQCGQKKTSVQPLLPAQDCTIQASVPHLII